MSEKSRIAAGVALCACLGAGHISSLGASQGASQTFTFKAEVLNADVNAQHHSATVVVTTEGFQLVDADSSQGVARIGEGHIHYRVDDDPVIATTATKISFHELSSGTHTIVVMLAGNDHKALTAPITFTLRIP